MANQGQNAARQASASIGQQESQNQMASAQQAGQLQSQERAGEATAEGLRLGGAVDARGLKYEKQEALMGMAAGELSSANEAVAAAEAKKAEGMSQMMGGVASGAMGAMSAFGGDDTKDIIGKIA